MALDTLIAQSLTDGTLASAKLLFVKQGATTWTGDTEFLGRISDEVNFNNPLLAYTSGVNVTESGYTSVTVEYEIEGDHWSAKDKKGSSAFDAIADVEFDSEVFKWNKPVKFEEAIAAFDIKKGRQIDVLAARMTKAGQRFTKLSVKKAFAGLVKKAIVDGAKGELDLAKATGETTQEHGQRVGAELKALVRTFLETNEFNEDEVTLTISGALLDILAEARLLGDQVKVQFDGGAYTIADFGGYKVQAGSFMTNGKYNTTTGAVDAAAGADFLVLIGTARAGLHQVDTIAANIAKMGASNDQQTYLEMTDIFGVMDYKGKLPAGFGGKPHLFAITAKK